MTQVQVAAHEIFMGEPVGPLHAMDDDDRTLCEDYARDELIAVPLAWADTLGRRCPGCEVTASALGVT